MGNISKSFALILILLTTVLVTFPSFYPVKADSEEPIHFVDSGLTIYSPVNMTYNAYNLALNVTLNGAGTLNGIDPQISMNYNIDGSYSGDVPLKWDGEYHVVTAAVATISLPKLSNGPHELTIYLYGLNQESYTPRYLSFTYTVYFSTTGNPPTPSPTPTVPEFSTWIILPLFAVTILLSTAFVRKRMTKNHSFTL